MGPAPFANYQLLLKDRLSRERALGPTTRPSHTRPESFSHIPHPSPRTAISLCALPSARLTLLDSQPHTSLLLLLLIIIMIYGYSIHVPCRLPRARHILLHPPSPWSALCKRRTLTRTRHSDIQTFFDACDNPWRSVESTVAQHYSILTCMLRTSFKRGAQRLPSLSGIPAPTNKKSYWYVRKRAAHLRRNPAAAHDSFARRTSPGPTPLKLLNLGRAD
jgi:hypothetical protein